MTIKSNTTSPAQLFRSNGTTSTNRSPHSIRLRSPKGTSYGSSPITSTTSKRKQRNYNGPLSSNLDSILSFLSTLLQQVFVVASSFPRKQKHKFFSVLLVLFPVAFITTLIHQNSTSTTDIIQQQQLNFNNNIPTTTKEGVLLATTTIQGQNTDKKEIDINVLRTSFDSSMFPIIPKSMYQPKSSNPIQVMYVGRYYGKIYSAGNIQDHALDEEIDEGNDDTDEIFDALQRSSYIKVVSKYLYTQTIANRMYPTTYPLLIYQQYHDLNINDAVTTPVSTTSSNRHSTISELVDIDAKKTATTTTTTITFIVDWSALLRDCHTLQRIIKRIYSENLVHIIHEQKQKSESSFMLLIVLLDESPSSQSITCSRNGNSSSSNKYEYLIHLPVPFQIRLVKRSIVKNRIFNYTKNWIERGTLITNNIYQETMPFNNNIDIIYRNNILYWSGYVSQSFVSILDIVTQQRRSQGGKTVLSRLKNQQRIILKKLLPTNHHDRPIHVSHYWKSSTKKTDSHNRVHQKHQQQNHHCYYYNRLRQTVRSSINNTRIEIAGRNHKKITTDDPRWVEFVGIDASVDLALDNDKSLSSSNDHDADDDTTENGNDFTKSVHIAVLASSKIVVVTQADEYEDNDNRLMEALASGALVLCDTMIAPPNGLIHKTNVVFYNDTSNLKRYIQYYLHPKNEHKRQEIARHGMEYALGRHRSWHVLEAVLFGKALTRTDKYPLMDVGPDCRKPTKEVLSVIIKL